MSQHRRQSEQLDHQLRQLLAAEAADQEPLSNDAIDSWLERTGDGPRPVDIDSFDNAADQMRSRLALDRQASSVVLGVKQFEANSPSADEISDQEIAHGIDAVFDRLDLSPTQTAAQPLALAPPVSRWRHAVWLPLAALLMISIGLTWLWQAEIDSHRQTTSEVLELRRELSQQDAEVLVAQASSPAETGQLTGVRSAASVVDLFPTPVLRGGSAVAGRSAISRPAEGEQAVLILTPSDGRLGTRQVRASAADGEELWRLEVAADRAGALVIVVGRSALPIGDVTLTLDAGAAASESFSLTVEP